MARDQIEVDLLLNAKKAEATIKQMNRELGKMGKTMGQAFSGTGGGASNNVRALGTGLSKATVRADEFSKSLEASNARVIAFGASAGLIMNVDRALRAMVKTTIQVEKAMADVNVVMNISSKQLDRFGKGMFKVAKETAQGFSTVAEASTELARQGLGMEKTLARTKDALILTRLTGMNAADAVKSLTAAVNSFNKEGTTSSQVINRMAKVDAAFAVSSEDLAKAISRVGSSAVDAGVSLNQLMAITTSVQQKTARGGAVIGNAFKTIFTRIQRSDVRKTLSDIGVATTDMSGKMLDGVTVLENLSKSFGRLTKVQQASVAESVAGVFQVNILRAAMSDLSTKNSEYAKALRVANSATNEAYKRNEQLNQTLDALANKTMVNLTQAGAALGGDLFGPAIKKVLGTVNSTLESFGKGGAMEGIGQTIGKGLVTGIGNFIGGPGLIIATAVFGKLALNLSKFATTAFKDIMGINTAVKQRAALEEIVVNTLASEPALLQKVKMGTLGVLDVEKQILATIKQQQVERAALKGYGGAIAGSLHQRGTRVGSSGRAFSRGMGRASGFVPNFANANSERAAAAAGGYTAGAIKTMSQPGAGTMMYNSAETVKQFPGMSQKAIMPPSNSSAGANYRSTFGAAHGFDPYAAGGFVPNFRRKQSKMTAPKAPITNTILNAKNPIGVLLGEGPSEAVRKDYEQLLFAGPKNPTGKGSISGIAKKVPSKLVEAYQKGLVANPRVIIKDVLTKGVFPLKSGNIRKSGQSTSFKDEFEKLEKSLGNFAGSIQTEIFGKDGKDRTVGNVIDFMGSSAKGEIFEASIRAALKQSPSLLKGANKNAPFDFNPFKAPDEDLLNLFGLKNLARIEAKIGGEAANNIVSKYANEFGEEPSISSAAKSISQKIRTKKNNASGFIPNFSSPLGSSVGREMAAGIPASAIRVGSSPALRSSKNPSGLGVYNTKDEPMGLNQGISRSRSMGINPKSHGAAEGFVPNFISGAGIMSTDFAAKDQKKAAETQQKAAKDNTKASSKIAAGADKMMMAGMMINMALSGAGGAMGVGQKTQGGLNAISNIGSMAMMGSGYGLPGVIAGGALGALTSIDDIGTVLGFKDAEIAAEEMKAVAAELKQSFGKLKDSFGTLRNFDTKSPLERIAALIKIVETVESIEAGDSSNDVVASLRKNLRSRLNIDKVLKGGNLSSLPAEQLEKMEKELVAAQTEILAATQGQDMASVLEKSSGLMKVSGMDGPFVANLTQGAGAAIKQGKQDFLRGRFSADVQSKLVGVPEARVKTPGFPVPLTFPSGVDTLKSIGARSREIQSEIESASAMDSDMDQGISPSEADSINKRTMSVADDLSILFGRANLPALKAEIDNNVNAINKTKNPEAKKMKLLALSDLMANLSTDPSLQAFINPEAMGASAKGKGKDAASQMTQGEFDALRRHERIGRAEDSVSVGVKLNRRLGRIRRKKSSADVGRANRGRMASITMAGGDLIDEQAAISTEAAKDKAKAARKEIIANQQSKLDKKELKAFGSMVDAVSKVTKNIDDKNELIEKYNKEYRHLEEEDIQKEIKRIQSEVPKNEAAKNSKME
jgi:TP901 family phage tail tape measure protein